MTRINASGPVAPFIPEGVILDIDGLMIDTEQLETGFYVEISGKMGWPTPRSMLKNTIGLTDRTSRVFYQKTYGDDYPYTEIWDAVKEQETAYAEKNGLPHKKGLLVLLDKLKSLGIPLAVGTSNKTERALWKLEHAGILDRFTALACGDEIENSKPAPDVFLLAAKKLRLKPEHCVGFEDSPAGLAGLASAGIPSVFIKDLADPAPDVLASVWYQCSDLEEAAALFG
jgi:HAD superfamily hydrolase (TIGR01509 family)